MASYYRVHDALENFKLKVVVRELPSKLPYGDTASSLGSNHDHNRVQAAPFDDSKEISWQEKLLGPREVVEQIRKGGDVDSRLPELKNTMLYTYTERDNFFPAHKSPIDGWDEKESYVGASMFGAINSSLGSTVSSRDARSHKVFERHLRDKRSKAMHICLGTDIDSKTIQENKPSDLGLYFTENLLCSIYVYKDGLVEITPGVSTIVTENVISKPNSALAIPKATAMENYSGGMVGSSKVEEANISLALDDTTVKAGIKKGFKLSTFRLLSRHGTEYEYTIQVVNDVLSPLDLEELRLNEVAADTRAAESSRVSLKQDEVWKQDPPAKGFDKIVSHYAEIISASGFESSRLFITYQIVVPHGWNLRTGNVVDGIAEEDIKRASKKGTAEQRKLASQALENDGFDDGEDALGALNGSTQCAQTREWRMGNPYSSGVRRMWNVIPFTFDKGTRIILGLSFFLVTCISIILGASYPFWLVPTITIVFAIGTGYPAGPIEIITISGGKADKAKVGEGFNRGASNALKSSRKHTSSSLTSLPVAYFNHLMGVSFDVKDPEIENQTIAPSANVPTLLFQVYGMGIMERCVLEGYGYAHLPSEPGMIALDVRTWKPLGGIEGHMKEFFLGSSSRLKDANYVENMDKMSASINRFGVQTGSSGFVSFRCNTVVTDPRKKQVIFSSAEAPLPPSERKTVEDILYKFKNTLLMSKSLNASISGASLGSITSRLSGVAGRTDSNAGHHRPTDSLQDILARARAKVAGASAVTASVSKSMGSSGPLSGLASGPPSRERRPGSSSAKKQTGGNTSDDLNHKEEEKAPLLSSDKDTIPSDSESDVEIRMRPRKAPSVASKQQAPIAEFGIAGVSPAPAAAALESSSTSSVAIDELAPLSSKPSLRAKAPGALAPVANRGRNRGRYSNANMQSDDDDGKGEADSLLS